MHRTFDGMTWPAPCEQMGDLVHRLTWGRGETTKQDRLLAASIIGAYMQMVSDPERKRRSVIAELRKGPNLPRKAPNEPPAGEGATCENERLLARSLQSIMRRVAIQTTDKWAHDALSCTYPDCRCPFDAPADPNWCALGLPHIHNEPPAGEGEG